MPENSTHKCTNAVNNVQPICDEFLMGCKLLTAFVHLCVLFSGILVHFVSTLTGYADILLNRILCFLNLLFDNL